MKNNIFNAEKIAVLLKEKDGRLFLPTAEQRAVIESPITGTTLVVAGAGSGKTETIANRVIWLIANGYAEPEEILGLTFTKKAAGELALRVQSRLHTFVENGLDPDNDLTDDQRDRINALHHTLNHTMQQPNISTYNAFAVAVFLEFGALAGFSSDAKLIDNAVAWDLANQIVVKADDDALLQNDFALNSLIDNVLDLNREVNENLADYSDVIKNVNRFVLTIDLPRDEKVLAGTSSQGPYADIRKKVSEVKKTLLQVELAKQYAELKKSLNFLEYSDQVNLALQTVLAVPRSIKTLSGRSKIILLDEVQDTSHAQTKLLAQIFAKQHVMGVGDPNQSIYGWRGASAESLTKFNESFNGEVGAKNSRVLTLSTSWRNSKKILEIANAVSAPLRKELSIPVPELSNSDSAIDGKAETLFFETLEEEAQHVAEWLKQRIKIPNATKQNPNKDRVTAAIIFRFRKHMQTFADVLAKNSIPHKIVGLGGLLTTPEVTDIIAVLKVLWYPDAGSELIRILNGPRFAVGTADLAGLRNFAKYLDRKNQAATQEQDLNSMQKPRLVSRQTVTIIDALDELLTPQNVYFASKMISRLGIARMSEAAMVLRHLRSLASNDLVDLIREIETEMFLDIELEVRDSMRGSETPKSRANVFAFISEVRNFIDITENVDLRKLIMWLEKSKEDDSLSQNQEAPSAEEVQLITVHSAKGLEWDLVCVPRLNASEFPAKTREKDGWLYAGKLPDENRGDRTSRPQLLIAGVETQKELRENMKAYAESLAKAHLNEERRLAYVAFTRAKQQILLTGSFWSKLKTAQKPSIFLEEAAAVLEAELPEKSDYEELPETHSIESLMWPIDPLGERREHVKLANKKVLEQYEKIKETINTDVLVNESLSEELRVLLAEYNSLKDTLQKFSVPKRINASSFQDFIKNPEEAFLNAKRPLPAKPFKEARVGNFFHDWVEKRTTTEVGTKLLLPIEELPEELSALDKEEAALFEKLVQNFENSKWGTKLPLQVELEISIPFTTGRMVCKLDAVFETGDGFEIVDWKTGKAPKNKQEKEERLLQLDLYRHAYAQYAQIPVEKIDAYLFYLKDNTVIQVNKTRTLKDLEKLWVEALQKLETT